MVVWRRWIFPILMVVVFGLIAASLVKVAFFPDQQAAAEVPIGQVTDPVVPVERGSIVNQLDVTGTVARDEAVPLRSDVDGVVSEAYVGEGARVEAGQALFKIKLSDPVRYVVFTAPFAGELSEVALVKNQATSVGTEFTKITPNTFHVLGTIEPVQLYRLINAPTDATVTITGGPAPFTCTGLTVQVAQDAATSVRCAVPADQTVFAGLPATIGITVGTVEDALVVPTTAVRGGAGSGIVWVDADGTAEERTVTLGISDGVTIEVLEGLEEGEQIRQFVPGVEKEAEQMCYPDGMGGEFCESVVQW
ncbi:hypothetical protein ASD65_17315 [Microbacterium sp. Root61]|uniref:efflux RND transporter periplasmic adaptor subunit n=1 Tax=Microbacterium sp. Root61 TaxID=1736570 RepID=UPI0006FA9E9B|nr:biotin/lipoyl-binding protein [Microbacterium sp. Root61]KRA22257.1 hypothetical protein ASD65_17315 [Microbacterium sp. Root61]